MELEIQKKIQNYYDDKLRQHGATARGVDWKNLETQEIRFSLLAHLMNGNSDYEINDLGCGYGAFAKYLENIEAPFRAYYGYDISSEMIAEAKKQFAKSAKCQFFPSGQPVKHTYTVSSGIFNVMLDVPPGKWVEVIEQLLQTMYDASSTGFAFNMLNQPTDEIYRRDYLYYADPEYYETYCRKRFGKKVTVLSHSELFEFTILVSDLYSSS